MYDEHGVLKLDYKLNLSHEPHFLSFLNDWLDWVERGAPDGEPYSRSSGLCVGLNRYMRRVTEDIYRSADVDLTYTKQLFGVIVPFPDYALDLTNEIMHLNPHRLAWVRLQTGRPAA